MKIRTTLVSVLAALFVSGIALPQDNPLTYDQDPAQDPPSRVARLNWLSGNVSFQPSGIDTWAPATLNYPLTTGDHLYTDTGSRAEIHVGPNALRMNGLTNVGFLNLDDRTVQVRFTEGALEIRLRRLEDDDIYEVDTPQGAVSLLRTGDYRIDTDPSRNATMVTVSSGEAEVTANGRSFIIHSRQTAYIPDGYDPDIRTANSPDDFDDFTRDRNLREDRLPPPVHVSESMVGYEDLDQYGSWSQSPDYGWVWAPRVAAGWAPYHEGRWAWIEPWGWTWIDEAPWGFAPFHYGRWAYVGGGWVWAPGARVPRPVYAPALVAFVGGPRFTLSLAVGTGGAIGWFPLGPREPFYPSYRVSNTYVRQVNITHVTNVRVDNVSVTNVRYINREVPGAVFGMPRQGFGNGRPVHQSGQSVPRQELANAQFVGTAPQIAPRRESVIGVQTNRSVAAPSREVMSRPVVARTAAPPPAVSFEARQQMIERNQGRPLAHDQLNQLRQQPGAVMTRPDIRTAPAVIQAAPRPQTFERPNRRMDSPTPRPEIQQQETPRPEFTRPRPEQRPAEVQRPEVQRPEAQRPEVPRPEVPRPEVQRQEMRRPETPRPQPEQRPERQRQETPRPEFTRPQPEQRPAPAAAPRPENRPQPEVRREAPPAAREQRREERPAPVREQKKEDKKDK